MCSLADGSDAGHVMWLNKNISKQKLDPNELENRLAGFFADRNLKNEGASLSYFDPEILASSRITEATKNFLRKATKLTLSTPKRLWRS